MKCERSRHTIAYTIPHEWIFGRSDAFMDKVTAELESINGVTFFDVNHVSSVETEQYGTHEEIAA